MKILNLHGYGAQPHNGFFYALAEYHAGEILLPAILTIYNSLDVVFFT